MRQCFKQRLQKVASTISRRILPHRESTSIDNRWKDTAQNKNTYELETKYLIIKEIEPMHENSIIYDIIPKQRRYPKHSNHPNNIASNVSISITASSSVKKNTFDCKHQYSRKKKEKRSQGTTNEQSPSSSSSSQDKQPIRFIDCNESCPICWDAYRVGEKICWSKNRACCHGFHLDCIMTWASSDHNRCPLCRIPYFKKS